MSIKDIDELISAVETTFNKLKREKLNIFFKSVKLHGKSNKVFSE